MNGGTRSVASIGVLQVAPRLDYFFPLRDDVIEFSEDLFVWLDVMPTLIVSRSAALGVAFCPTSLIAIHSVF